MKERLQIKRDYFQRKFEILKVISKQVAFIGHWNYHGTQFEMMDDSGNILIIADKKTPKGIYLSWNTKYEISFPYLKKSTELICTKPFKNLWEANLDERNFKLNSPLRKDVEIYQGDELILKEIEEDDFLVKTSDYSKMTASIAFYLCIRRQHSELADI